MVLWYAVESGGNSEVLSVTWRVRTALPWPSGTAVVTDTAHAAWDAGSNMSPLEKRCSLSLGNRLLKADPSSLVLWTHCGHRHGKTQQVGGYVCVASGVSLFIRSRSVGTYPSAWEASIAEHLTFPGHLCVPILRSTFAAVPLPLPGVGPNVELGPLSFLSIRNRMWKAHIWAQALLQVRGEELLLHSREDTRGQTFIRPPPLPARPPCSLLFLLFPHLKGHPPLQGAYLGIFLPTKTQVWN